MAAPSLYDLVVSPDPQTQAAALQDALRRRRAIGSLMAATGDTRGLGGLGVGMVRSADDAGQQMGAAGRFRLQQAMQALQHGNDSEIARSRLDLERQRLALARQQMTQDAWSALADPVSGGIVMVNRKTGETRALGPGGGKPGALPPPKPKDLENDVQSLGKDVEPIAKIQPDLATLQGAAERGDVAGFGPVSGKVPNFLASQEGVANRQAAGRIMAGIIQMISGQAASEKEVERLLEANGLGRSATDAQFREGVSKLTKQYESLLTQREAKYHPRVVETYGERGGFVGPVVGGDGAGASVTDKKAARRALADEMRSANPNVSAAEIVAAIKAKGLDK